MIDNNSRLVYSAMPDRPRVTWPEGKTVAFWHAPNVEHYDWVAPNGWAPKARVAAPDAQHYMHRQYGNRVGLWRMLRVVDEFSMPCTVSLSLSLLQEDPEVREAMWSRDWEIMSHGISNLRPLYGYSREEEDEFLATSQALSEQYYGGRRIKGMLGPRISGTDNTSDLMVEHGMTYHADWVHDEHPRPIRTASGRPLVSVPYSYTNNDVPVLQSRNHPPHYFAELFISHIDRLLRDADRDGQGRVAALATHPYVIGQPGTADALRAIFDHVRSDDRVWVTTAGAVTDHFIENFHDEQVAHAENLLLEHQGQPA